MPCDEIVSGTIIDGDQAPTEYRRRKRDYDESKHPIGSAAPQGWTEHKRLKSSTVFHRQKSIGRKLQDKVWKIFYEMGITRLSSERFTIKLKERPGKPKTKEIDVVAFDDEVVFVVECKSTEKLQTKSLKQEIAEFAGNMQDIRTAIHKIVDKKIRVEFVLATENIVLDTNDLQDAFDSKIQVWDEYALLELEELAALAGDGAKFQIYNRIFKGRKIKSFEVRVPALKGVMGGETFYSFVMSPEHLLKIGYVHQRAEGGVSGISKSYQRVISSKRVSAVEQYIENGGFFPGSIIINFTKPIQEENYGRLSDLKDASPESRPVIITLPPYYGSAWIIDGQHRLYGYANLEKHRVNERMPVVAFVCQDEDFQAQVFVDINEKQQSIEANLLWDLYEDLYENSSKSRNLMLYAVSMVAKLLDSEKSSPLAGSVGIPRLRKLNKERRNISLSELCRSIRQHGFIGEDGELRHGTIKESIEFAADRLSVMFNFFKKEMPAEWEAGDAHFIRTNAAVFAFLGIFREILENLSASEKCDISGFEIAVSAYLKPIVKHLRELTQDEIDSLRAGGASGQKGREVRRRFTSQIKKALPTFKSRWLESLETPQELEPSSTKGEEDRIEQLLSNEESAVVEFKASYSKDIRRFLKDGQLISDDKLINEVLGAIVGFLNTNGGTLVLGIAERPRFPEIPDERFVEYTVCDKYVVLGIETEYEKKDWDRFHLRLSDHLKTRVDETAQAGGLISIRKVQFKMKDLCVIEIKAKDQKTYLDGKEFCVRDGNRTCRLEGEAIDKFWRQRA